jgi:hypothetical protein
MKRNTSSNHCRTSHRSEACGCLSAVELIILWNLRSWIFTYQFPNVTWQNSLYGKNCIYNRGLSVNRHTKPILKLSEETAESLIVRCTPEATSCWQEKQIINLIPDRNFVKKINSHRTHMKMHKTTTWFIVYTYILWQKTLAENDWDNDNLLLCLRKGQKNKGRKYSGILRWSITSNLRIMTSLLVLGTQLQAGRQKRWSPCVTWHTAHSIIRFFFNFFDTTCKFWRERFFTH